MASPEMNYGFVFSFPSEEEEEKKKMIEKTVPNNPPSSTSKKNNKKKKKEEEKKNYEWMAQIETTTLTKYGREKKLRWIKRLKKNKGFAAQSATFITRGLTRLDWMMRTKKKFS